MQPDGKIVVGGFGIPNFADNDFVVVRFNPTGTRAYVTSAASPVGAAKVIDTATYKVINSIPVGDTRGRWR